MIALVIILATPQPLRCPVPKEAYILDRGLTAREIATFDHYAVCKCGPDGSVDFDPRPTPQGYRLEASCSSFGWNGRRYVQRGHAVRS